MLARWLGADDEEAADAAKLEEEAKGQTCFVKPGRALNPPSAESPDSVGHLPPDLCASRATAPAPQLKAGW